MANDELIVETCLAERINPADRERLGALRALVYPTPVPDAERKQAASDPPPARHWPDDQRRRLFLIRDGAMIIATSQLIPRQIKTTAGPLVVLGLASVKTHPDFRERGLGRAVVRAALEYVDSGRFGVSLFQTGVPGFYQKLGCGEVDNPFVNSRGHDPGERPWWQRHAMIYPAAFDWPCGTIDLLGPGW